MDVGSSDAIYQLQTWLMSVENDNYINSVINIQNSIFMDEEYATQFAICIYTAVDHRPMNIPIFAEMLSMIHSEKTPIFNDLKPYFIHNCFSEWEKKKGRLFFLLNCYQQSLLNIDDVKYVLTHPNPHNVSIEHSFNYFYWFCWFAPEFEEKDKPYFDITLNWFIDASKYLKRFPSDLKEFAQNITKLRKNNWRKLKEMRSNNTSHIPLLEILKDDDFDIFQVIESEPGFDYEQRIQPSIFDIHWIIYKSPTLFDYAAYFGSIKCFKYIFLNYIKQKKVEQNKNAINVVHFAIAGGNIEIVRLLHTYDFDFTGAPHFAALYHRNEIFDWTVSVLEIPIKQYLHFDHASVLEYAAKSFNISAIDYCFDENIFDDDPLNRQFTFLHFATENCIVEVVDYVLHKFEFDLLQQIFTESILYYPITIDRLDYVKFFVSKEPRLVNLRSHFQAPIWTAAQYGRIDIVNFLSQHPSISITPQNKSELSDPYEEAETPFPKTTNVFEFTKYQMKRRLEIIRSKNPFFIGIK